MGALNSLIGAMAINNFAAKLKREENKWRRQNIKGEKDPQKLMDKYVNRANYLIDGYYKRFDSVYPKNRYYDGQPQYGIFGTNLHVRKQHGDDAVHLTYGKSVDNHFKRLPSFIGQDKQYWLNIAQARNTGIAEEYILRNLPAELKNDTNYVALLKNAIHAGRQVQKVEGQKIAETKNANADLFPENLPVNTTVKRNVQEHQEEQQSNK